MNYRRLILFFFFQTLIIITTLIVDSVKNTAEHSIWVCHITRSYFERNSEVHDELETFAQVVTQTVPKFTAAGFFEINRRTIFHVFSVTATYFIVIIQFYK